PDRRPVDADPDRDPRRQAGVRRPPARIRPASRSPARRADPAVRAAALGESWGGVAGTPRYADELTLPSGCTPWEVSKRLHTVVFRHSYRGTHGRPGAPPLPGRRRSAHDDPDQAEQADGGARPSRPAVRAGADLPGGRGQPGPATLPPGLRRT